MKQWIILLLTFSGVHFSAQAAPDMNSGTQLAYFIGTHSLGRGEVIYYTPYPRNYYRIKTYIRTWGPSPAPRYVWTRWHDVGYGCRSSCLIDTYFGQAIRCNRSCVY